MKKQNLIFTILILFFATGSAMNMKRSATAMDIKTENQSKELFMEFRSLLPELQRHILLLKNDIIFLSQQPITLAGPHGHTHEIYSVEIAIDEDDKCATDEYEVVTAGKDNMVKVWDINTGNFLHEFASTDDNDYTKHIVPYYHTTPTPNGPFISGINTGQLMRKTEENNMRSIWESSPVFMNNKLIMVTRENTVILEDTDPEKTLLTLAGPHQHNRVVSSIAIDKHIIITGSWDCTAKIWEGHTGEFLRTLAGHHGHTDHIWAVEIYDDIAITGSRDKTAKIWNVQSGTCLRTLAGPNGHTDEVTAVMLDNTYAVTGSRDCTAKIWPLFPNLKGTPETNPLLWIIHNTNMLQCDFIQRAYEKTIAIKDFIITLPKKFNVIEEDELQEQMDCRIYFTLPCAVRAYLRTRLKIQAKEAIPQSKAT